MLTFISVFAVGVLCVDKLPYVLNIDHTVGCNILSLIVFSVGLNDFRLPLLPRCASIKACRRTCRYNSVNGLYKSFACNLKPIKRPCVFAMFSVPTVLL